MAHPRRMMSLPDQGRSAPKHAAVASRPSHPRPEGLQVAAEVVGQHFGVGVEVLLEHLPDRRAELGVGQDRAERAVEDLPARAG